MVPRAEIDLDAEHSVTHFDLARIAAGQNTLEAREARLQIEKHR